MRSLLALFGRTTELVHVTVACFQQMQIRTKLFDEALFARSSDVAGPLKPISLYIALPPPDSVLRGYMTKAGAPKPEGGEPALASVFARAGMPVLY